MKKIIFSFILSLYALANSAQLQSPEFFPNANNFKALVSFLCVAAGNYSTDAIFNENLYTHQIFMQQQGSRLLFKGLCLQPYVNDANSNQQNNVAQSLYLDLEVDLNLFLQKQTEYVVMGKLGFHRLELYFSKQSFVENDSIRQALILKRAYIIANPNSGLEFLEGFSFYKKIHSYFREATGLQFTFNKGKWSQNFDSNIELYFKDSFDRSHSSTRIQQNQNIIMIDIVSALDQMMGSNSFEEGRAGAIFFVNADHISGCSQITDKAESKNKLTSSMCSSILSR